MRLIAPFIGRRSFGWQSLRHGGRIAQSTELAQCPAGPPELVEDPGAARRIGQHGHRELPVRHEEEVGNLPAPRSAVLVHRHAFGGAAPPEGDTHAVELHRDGAAGTGIGAHRLERLTRKHGRAVDGFAVAQMEAHVGDLLAGARDEPTRRIDAARKRQAPAMTTARSFSTSCDAAMFPPIS